MIRIHYIPRYCLHTTLNYVKTVTSTVHEKKAFSLCTMLRRLDESFCRPFSTTLSSRIAFEFHSGQCKSPLQDSFHQKRFFFSGTVWAYPRKGTRGTEHNRYRLVHDRVLQMRTRLWVGQSRKSLCNTMVSIRPVCCWLWKLTTKF